MVEISEKPRDFVFYKQTDIFKPTQLSILIISAYISVGLSVLLHLLTYFGSSA